MPGLCSLLCSSGPLNVRNVKFHLAARSTPSTFVGRGTAELGEALQKLCATRGMGTEGRTIPAECSANRGFMGL